MFRITVTDLHNQSLVKLIQIKSKQLFFADVIETICNKFKHMSKKNIVLLDKQHNRITQTNYENFNNKEIFVSFKKVKPKLKPKKIANSYKFTAEIQRCNHPKIAETLYCKGYLCLKSEHINQLAKQAIQDYNISQAYVDAKIQRDGPNFHMTLVSPPEMQKLFSKKQKNAKEDTIPKNAVENKKQLLETFAGISDNWEPIGVGKIQKENPFNECYFILVKWDAAKEQRHKIGLSGYFYQYFHITLGFAKKDIHDVPKNLDTLITL